MRRHDKHVAAMLRIKKEFNDVEGSELMFQIINQAVKDLTAIEEYDIRSARKYLRQPTIPAAEICNIDSGWIRLTLKRAGVEF